MAPSRKPVRQHPVDESVTWAGDVVPRALVVLALWSLLPVGVWWAGSNIRYYEASWNIWLPGTAVAVLVAASALLLTRGRAALAMLALWRRTVARGSSSRFVVLVATALALLAVLMCLLAFSGKPRTVDGFADLFQARIFLSGRLWATPPPELANFATLLVALTPRWFSQYPPGQPLVLAAGLMVGAWWLLNALFAALLVAATWRVARWCTDDGTARLAVMLLCVSPFVLAMAGSEMSHLPSAALGMLAAAAATTAFPGRWIRGSVAAGILLGVMVAFRPMDAAAAAAPVALILLQGAPRRRAVAAVGVAGLAAMISTVPTLWYNGQTTGHWLLFGYQYLWGPEHSLGFHAVPFGIPLTPLRAVGLIGLDLHQLNRDLFAAPFPIVVLIALGVTVGRRQLTQRDAVALAGVLALLGFLFFYWHRDWVYGPRFLFSAVPWVVILLARALVTMRRSGRELWPGVSGGLAATFTAAVILLGGLVVLLPPTLKAYSRATPIFDLHPDRDARRAGISHAVVVIPDGWGERLYARMLGFGVTARQSMGFYDAIDACSLEQALDAVALEPTDQRRPTLVRMLDSLAALGRPGVYTGATWDTTLRLPADTALAPVCRSALDFDASGFLNFVPFLYLNRPSLDGDIVWARDLGPWNAALFARYPDRKLYRYAPQRPGGRPSFIPIERTAEGSGSP